MSALLDNVVSRLDGVTGRGEDLKAKCPAHEDGHASLSVGLSKQDGRVLLNCFAGCRAEDILAALGLEWADLFEGEPERNQVVCSYLYETGRGEPWFWKDRTFPKSFRLRLPGTEPGDHRGIGNRTLILYHLPQLYAGIMAGRRIWLVEGEKDVHALERHGEVATTTCGGAGATWRDEYTRCFAGAKEVIIVADQDKVRPDGTLGPGHQHAIGARDAFRAAGIPVRIARPASGKDADDHFRAGHEVGDFTIDRAAYTRPRGMTADELAKQDFEPLNYAIDGILPEGLAMLAAPPKSGKSWICLSLALGVAAGGLALDACRTLQGDVMYLAREDGYRRLQSRMDLLTRGDQDAGKYLKHLEVIPADVPWVGGDIGLSAMTDWAEEMERPRLVVIDTLAKVEPDTDERKDRYKSDYSVMAKYKAWADRYHLTVLMVHHDRKGTDDGGDVFNRISGTKGITGAADTLWFLEAKRGEQAGRLHVTGRDVHEQTLEMTKAGPIWRLIEEPLRIHARPRLVR